MTGGQGSTERHYRRLLDKLKSRSNRIFVKAQMQNRTQDQRLKKVVSTLEKDRDLRIRKSHEGIWKVSSKECPMPRLAKPVGQPSYLGRPKATTLPTPAELATLLPKKRASRQYASAHHTAHSVATEMTSTQPLKQYTKMSKRRLSTLTSEQLQIRHYRNHLTDLEEALEDANETDEVKAENGPEDKTGGATQGAGATSEDKWASPVKRTKSSISEADRMSMDESTFAAEESVRMVMKKLGIRPQSSPMSYSQRTRLKHLKKRRPQTSTGTPCATISEQKGSGSKVLRTNYLDMYKSQMESHMRRMASPGTMSAPSARTSDRSTPDIKTMASRETAPTTISQTPTKFSSSNKFSSPSFAHGSRGIATPTKKQKSPRSTLMQDTAASTSRSSPQRQMRRVSTQVMHASAFDTLHEEVQRVQSYAKFRRESLQVEDIANLEDVEEGELFDEMKNCRYIRWGKRDEAIIEEMEESEPLQLQNKLALLTLKYAPPSQSEKKGRDEDS